MVRCEQETAAHKRRIQKISFRTKKKVGERVLINLRRNRRGNISNRQDKEDDDDGLLITHHEMGRRRVERVGENSDLVEDWIENRELIIFDVIVSTSEPPPLPFPPLSSNQGNKGDDEDHKRRNQKKKRSSKKKKRKSSQKKKKRQMIEEIEEGFWMREDEFEEENEEELDVWSAGVLIALSYPLNSKSRKEEEEDDYYSIDDDFKEIDQFDDFKDDFKEELDELNDEIDEEIDEIDSIHASQSFITISDLKTFSLLQQVINYYFHFSHFIRNFVNQSFLFSFYLN